LSILSLRRYQCRTAAELFTVHKERNFFFLYFFKHTLSKKMFRLKVIDNELYMFWSNFVFEELFPNKKSYEVRFTASRDIYIYLLWSVEPLLCNDREMGLYARAVSGQRLGKHVPTATDTKATMVQQQRNGMFCCPCCGRCYTTVR
jgi:hypothetical protein